jgi:hypothetical protein
MPTFVGEQERKNSESSEMLKPTNFWGEHSPFSAAFVPVVQRGVNHTPSFCPAPHREPRSTHLTSSNFVSDIVHRPRDMGHYPRMQRFGQHRKLDAWRDRRQCFPKERSCQFGEGCSTRFKEAVRTPSRSRIPQKILGRSSTSC